MGKYGVGPLEIETQGPGPVEVLVLLKKRLECAIILPFVLFCVGTATVNLNKNFR